MSGRDAEGRDTLSSAVRITRERGLTAKINAPQGSLSRLEHEVFIARPLAAHPAAISMMEGVLAAASTIHYGRADREPQQNVADNDGTNHF